MAPTLGPTPSRLLMLLLTAGADTPSAAAALTMLPLDAVLTNMAIPDKFSIGRGGLGRIG